ncbi:MAG TPA: PilZ domain-containing protein [Candidatus Binatus sp.]|nr:PilZ domain-containing protein [Candidatus Binatus sp.]HWY21853.1 PilZ domain-containing protein [Candidatus Acidoferrum sp.]
MNLKHLDRREHSHPHRTHHHTSTAGVARNPVSKRRSNRMALNAVVGLAGEDRQKATFNVSAKATNLNLHGAAVQIDRQLPIGCVLVVKNQRGMQVSARVVALLPALQGVATYGIEFVEQDEKGKNFWGISFPSNA